MRPTTVMVQPVGDVVVPNERCERDLAAEAGVTVVSGNSCVSGLATSVIRISPSPQQPTTHISWKVESPSPPPMTPQAHNTSHHVHSYILQQALQASQVVSTPLLYLYYKFLLLYNYLIVS